MRPWVLQICRSILWSIDCLLSIVAPPLTVDEVLKAVSGVNWRKLGKELIGETVELSYRISRHDPPQCTNLDRIHDEHESDVAHLRAVVEEFLCNTGISRSYRRTQKTPSWKRWKRVIWALYIIDEIDKAQQIRSYAEPLRGICAIADITLWNNV